MICVDFSVQIPQVRKTDTWMSFCLLLDTNMPTLKDLDLKLSYRSGRDNLVNDFFLPCLGRSVSYKRAAGYFTSAGLALAARGIAGLASRNGEMRLIASPYMEPDDVEALQKAYDNPESILKAIAWKNLHDIEDTIFRDRLNALAWLAASGLLQVKLAIRVNSEGEVIRGIFHEKTGLFSDYDNNQVAFAGSSNETTGGFVENFESIKVFCSWRDSEGRVKEELENFDDLWNDNTPGLKIIEFSQATAELVDQFRDPSKPLEGLKIKDFCQTKINCYGKVSSPKWMQLRDYQVEAIRAWVKAGGKGIFSMATGTGKTLTALALAAKVAEKNYPLAIIIVCPYISICRQWIGEAALFGAKAIPCFEGQRKWQSLLEESYQQLSSGLKQVSVFVATNSTFKSKAFQSSISNKLTYSGIHHLIIADEVHNLGSPKMSKSLPDGIAMRLGLSATPERHNDPEGTAALINYFGDDIFSYPLSKAVADGHLTPYLYYPIIVKLNYDEAESYLEITSSLARLMSGNDKEGELNDAAMHLLIKRSRLLGSATNKITALEQLIGKMIDKPKKAIFYCGDGKTLDPNSDEDMRQIKAVARVLGEQCGLRVRNFTYMESSEERNGILQDLRSGFLDGVVAIRCLDEGIDLPDLDMGFILASSTNPRQFIQRRGRLLRKAPGKKRSVIYDFIVQPPDFGGEDDDKAFNVERLLFKRELKRISEFCSMAENGPEALQSLRELRIKYNLVAE